MLSLIARDLGAQRLWVCDQADTRTCAARITETIPPWPHAALYRRVAARSGGHPAHPTVRHGGQVWARDDDGEGRREVHGHTCAGAGAALRTDLRGFRGVHKPYLHLDVAT